MAGALAIVVLLVVGLPALFLAGGAAACAALGRALGRER